METTATATLLGMGAGAVGGVAAVSLMMGAQLVMYRAEKGPEWYEVKKAYMASKCGKYGGQACAMGACMGSLAADTESVALGMHPAAVMPSAMAAGCLCMTGCHGARILMKRCKKRAGKEEKEPESPVAIPETEDKDEFVDNREEEPFITPRKEEVSVNPLASLNPPNAQRKSREVKTAGSASGRGALSSEDEVWYQTELRRRRINAELLRTGNLPQYNLRDTEPPSSPSKKKKPARKTRSANSHPTAPVSDHSDDDSMTHLTWVTAGTGTSLGIGSGAW